MRIGDLDYLNRVKGTNGLQDEDGSAAGEADCELTQSQINRKKWKNWWDYHKWHVVCGILLLGILIDLTGSKLGWWTKTPDFQVAYVGKNQLPDDTVAALEQAFASLASDFNGDGETIVQINQYLLGSQNTDPDMLSYKYASEISLIGDISDCSSYFFLLEDPGQFQLGYQLLACPDGSCPDEMDYSVEDKSFLWTSCPILSEMDLGEYSVFVSGSTYTGSNQDLLSGLSIGRRCFYNDKSTEHADKCAELWDLLTAFR